MSAVRTTLSATERSALRRALKSHKEWSSYKKQYGIDIASASKDQLLTAAAILNIDIPRAEAQSNQKDENMNYQAKERPHGLTEVTQLQARFLEVRASLSGAAALTCANIFETAFNKQSGEMTVRQFAAISDIVTRAEGSKNAPKVEAAKEAAPVVTVTPAAPVSSNDPAAQLGALIAQLAGQSLNPETVARIVDERINEALAKIPTVKIECQTARGVEITEGRHHPKFITLLKAAACKQTDGFAPNIWLAGPAGSGKTHAAKELAKAMKLDFGFHGAMNMAHELLGYMDAGGTYHPTTFRRIFQNGGVILLDEVDAWDANATLALNAALANGQANFPDEIVRRHPDCIIIGAANTWGHGATADYVGRGKIDAAFLSRFPVRISWDYDAELEQHICGNTKWAMRVQAARAKAREIGLKVLIDPRATIAGAALISGGMAENEAAEITYLANMTADQRRNIH